MVKFIANNNSPQRVSSHHDFQYNFESPSCADHFNYPEVTPKNQRGLDSVSVASKQITKQKSSPNGQKIVKHDSISGKNVVSAFKVSQTSLITPFRIDDIVGTNSNQDEMPMQIDSEISLKQLSDEVAVEKSHGNESFDKAVMSPTVNQQLSEGSETRGHNEKYYKKFDFFYRRTAFRSMTEFYKGLFKPILDKWREGERKSTKNFV